MKPLDPEKRKSITRAVFAIAGQHGLSGINMVAISKEAAVGVGSLYTYFKNKEELIQAAYSSVEHEMTQKMYDRFDLTQPIRQSLERIYRNTLQYRLEHYAETIFIDHYIQSNYVQLNFSKQVKEFEEQNRPLYDLLKKGQEEGLFVTMDRFMMISFFNGAIRSLSNGIVQKLIPNKKQTFENGFHMVWRGMAR